MVTSPTITPMQNAQWATVPQLDMSWLGNLYKERQAAQANALNLENAQRKANAIGSLSGLDMSKPENWLKAGQILFQSGDTGSGVALIKSASDRQLDERAAAVAEQFGKTGAAPTQPRPPAVQPQPVPAIKPQASLQDATPGAAVPMFAQAGAFGAPTPAAPAAIQTASRAFTPTVAEGRQVDFNRVQPHVIAAATKAGEALGGPLRVTYATEGGHSQTGGHYQGEALDIRSRDMTSGEIQRTAQALKAQGFYVLIEPDHIHASMRPQDAGSGSVIADLRRGPAAGPSPGAVRTASLNPALYGPGAGPATDATEQPSLLPTPQARAAQQPASVVNPGGATAAGTTAPAPIAPPQLNPPALPSLAALGGGPTSDAAPYPTLPQPTIRPVPVAPQAAPETPPGVGGLQVAQAAPVAARPAVAPPGGRAGATAAAPAGAVGPGGQIENISPQSVQASGRYPQYTTEQLQRFALGMRGERYTDIRAAIGEEIKRRQGLLDKNIMSPAERLDFEKKQLDESYATHVAQARAAGQTPMSVVEWRKLMSPKPEDEGLKILKQEAAKEQVKYRAERIQLPDQIAKIDRMEKALAGAYTGAGAGPELALERWKAVLGLKSSASQAEVFDAMSKDLAMGQLGGKLGAGVSDADVRFITAMGPSLLTSKDGNYELLGIMRMVMERKLKVAELAAANAKRNGGILDPDQLGEEVAQLAASKPLFSDEQKQRMTSVYGAPKQSKEDLDHEQALKAARERLRKL